MLFLHEIFSFYIFHLMTYGIHKGSQCQEKEAGLALIDMATIGNVNVL